MRNVEGNGERKHFIYGVLMVFLLLVIIILIYAWINYCDHYIERHLDERSFLSQAICEKYVGD